MPTRNPILPGQANSLRRGRIRDALMAVAKKRQEKLRNIIEEQADMIVDDLRIMTPKDTGAAAGTTQGARRPIYKSHPASLRGLQIGNFEGASGWQTYMRTNGTHWAVINPMWDIYLAARNYIGPDAHFVEKAMQNFRNRMAALR